MTDKTKTKLNWLSSIGVILNLVLLIFSMGVFYETFNTLKTDVAEIKSKGSIRLRSHEDSDDARELVTKGRIAALELTVATIPDIRSDIRSIRENLERLREELKLEKK